MTDESVVNEQVVDATPGAVEHAEATGVDLSSVEGTGADGRITKADVTAAAEGAPAAFSDRDLASNKMPASRRVSETGDPLVHQLMADRQSHAMNLEAAQSPSPDIQYHKDAIEAIDKQLNDLGYDV